jgi:hypothetical protein
MVPPMSSSVIVSVAVSRPAMSWAPTGPVSASPTVSGSSSSVSCRMGTVKVRVRTVVGVPPAAKVSAPEGGVVELRTP